MGKDSLESLYTLFLESGWGRAVYALTSEGGVMSLDNKHRA